MILHTNAQKKITYPTILISIFVLLLLTTLNVAHATSSSAPNIEVTLLSQSPDPVEPGDVAEVRFKVENTGSTTNNNVSIEVLPTAPLHSYGVTKKNIGILRGDMYGTDSAIVDFLIKVAPDAIERPTELEVRINTGPETGILYVNKQFLIDIRSQSATISVVRVDVPGGTLAPGKKSTASLILKNEAGGLLKNIRAKLNLTGLPIAPTGTTAEQRLNKISAGAQAAINFPLIATPAATGGIYQVPLTLYYEDEQGNSFTRTDMTSLTIGETPLLKGYIKETSIITPSKGTITIELANTGTTDIKFLTLTLLPTENYTLLASTNTRYIGDIDSDDVETEEYTITTKKTGDITIPVEVEYTDVNNNPYTQTLELPLHIYSGWEARTLGLTSTSLAPYIIIILLIGGGAYWWWRRKKKKTQAQK